MKSSRILVALLLALLLGGIASWSALRSAKNSLSPKPTAEPTTASLVVLARDLEPGSVVSAADIRLVDWPLGSVPSGAFRNPDDAVGRGTRLPLFTGEPLLESKLVAKDAGAGFPLVIPEGFRAVSVKVDEVIGVSGFLAPGTLVDVLAVFSTESQDDEYQSRVILQNIQVAAVGQKFREEKEPKAEKAAVVTLLVTPNQAETLSLAALRGRIQLALRHPMDRESVETKGAKVSSFSGTSRSQPSPSTTNAPRRGGVVIETVNGTTRTVTRH